MNDQQRLEAALDEARTGSSLMALTALEGLEKHTNHPQFSAWLGYCLAKEKRDFPKALALCLRAIDTMPDNADLYLALGRLYRLCGRRYLALKTLRKGLKMGRSELIVKELTSLGLRKDRIFKFLERDHLLNIFADHSKGVQDVIGNQSPQILPAAFPGQLVGLGLQLAPAVRFQHRAVSRGGGVKADLATYGRFRLFEGLFAVTADHHER